LPGSARAALLDDLEAAQSAAADGSTLATVGSAVLSPSGRRLQDKTRWVAFLCQGW
jgi:hypothetical protein